MTKTSILLISIVCFASCQFIGSNKAEGNCTDIFKTTYITIKGLTLDDCYTLRISNKDTIREIIYDSNKYAVLNDRYRNALKNSTDSFHFVGLIKDSIVLIEPFIFNADNCHIHYVSGNTVLNF